MTSLPAGFRLVPIEPTQEMKDACDRTPGPLTAWKCWERMLAASPAPPTGEVEGANPIKDALCQTYQILGYHLGDTPKASEKDYERALDQVSAAIHGEPLPHADLLPWPQGATPSASPPAVRKCWDCNDTGLVADE